MLRWPRTLTRRSAEHRLLFHATTTLIGVLALWYLWGYPGVSWRPQHAWDVHWAGAVSFGAGGPRVDEIDFWGSSGVSTAVFPNDVATVRITSARTDGLFSNGTSTADALISHATTPFIAETRIDLSIVADSRRSLILQGMTFLHRLADAVQKQHPQVAEAIRARRVQVRSAFPPGTALPAGPTHLFGSIVHNFALKRSGLTILLALCASILLTLLAGWRTMRLGRKRLSMRSPQAVYCARCVTELTHVSGVGCPECGYGRRRPGKRPVNNDRARAIDELRARL